jgi:phosphotransferase system  glucose/maltose/N-acetylglucosamine-specific IIC component
MSTAQGIIAAACLFLIAALMVAALKLLGYMAGLSWGWIFAASVPGMVLFAAFAAAMWAVWQAGD